MQNSFISTLNLTNSDLIELGDIVTAFKSAVKVNSNDSDAYCKLGIGLYVHSYIDAAVKTYHAAISLQGDNPVIYYHLGHALYDQHKLNEAVEAYRKVVSLDPENIQARVSLAHVLRQQYKLNEAWQVCEEARKLDSQCPEVYVCLAQIFYKQELKLEDINKALQTASSLSEFYGKAYTSLGVDLYRQGNLDQALKVFKAGCQEVSQWMFDYYRFNSIMAGNEAIVEQGISICKLAIEANYLRGHAYFALGFIFSQRKEYVESVKAYNSLLLINDAFPGAYNNLAVVFKKQRNVEEALKACRKELLRNASHIDALCNIGIMLHEQGRLDEAIEAYERVIRIQPDHNNTYFNLGLVYETQNEWRKAALAYKRCININPYAEYAHENLADIMLRHNNLKGAHSLLSKSVQLDRSIIFPKQKRDRTEKTIAKLQNDLKLI